MRWQFAITAIVALAFMNFSCSGKKNNKEVVVLYSSVDLGYAREVAFDFEESTGIDVRLVSDTEAAKSAGLINRLVNERKRPVADVFWSGDPMRSAWLEREGIGTRISGTGSAYRVRMIMIHTEQEDPGHSRPKSAVDLAKTEYAAKTCIANPQFGTTSMHFAALFLELGEYGFVKFLNDFKANGGTVVASNGEVRRRVSSGEFTYGLTDSDDVSVALEDGYPVEWVLAGESGAGALAIPSTAVLIKGAPHPEKAVMLAKFLNSPEIEKIMANSVASHFPVLSENAKTRSFDFDLRDRKLAEYDDTKLAEALDRIRPIIEEWMSE